MVSIDTVCQFGRNVIIWNDDRGRRANCHWTQYQKSIVNGQMSLYRSKTWPAKCMVFTFSHKYHFFSVLFLVCASFLLSNRFYSIRSKKDLSIEYQMNEVMKNTEHNLHINKITIKS